jgi:hypothetical protein
MPLVIAGATSGSTTVQATDAVTATITLPSATGTLATLAGSETLTNKALNGTLGATTPSTVVATTVTASGLVTGASFQATGNAIAVLGDSLEGFVASSQAFVGSINRTSGNYLPLVNTGSVHTWRVGATTVGGILYTSQMNANGGLQVPNTVGVGGTTPSASGAGITFPATQSASTDANTLDDYEEGTWTPTSSGVTFSSASGTYTKIGQLVYLYCVCVYPTTANTARATVISLPFVAAKNAQGSVVDTALAYFIESNIDTAVGGNVINLYAPADSPVIRNSTLSTMTIRISITYTV